MCGIAGTAGFGDLSLLERMVGTIVHRGPDDWGTWLGDGIGTFHEVGLGNCRLAVLDLSPAGHQPMLGLNGRSALTYNGEVYNFAELRDGLEKAGERFHSRTDTEVVLRLLDRLGPACLSRLNGMFGLAYWDDKRRELILARDRYGIKPVYYAHLDDGRLVFASEVKALFACPDVPREVNVSQLDAYLRYLWVPGPETLFRGIYKLPPGHYLRWRDGRIEIRQYWDISYQDRSTATEAELTEELRSILQRAVKRHLISDVPVGLFLSGGLDSSTLLALTTDATTAPARAYTIAYRAEDALLEQAGQADQQHARLVAQHFGAEYNEIVVDPNIASLLPKVIYHLDEPIADPAAISTLLISKAAAEHVKVLLCGQGADEIFAGYRVHHALGLAALAGRIPGWLRDGPIRTGVGLLHALPTDPVGVPLGRRLAAQRYLTRLLDTSKLSPAERYVAMRSYYDSTLLRRLYSPHMRHMTENVQSTQAHLSYFDATPGGDGLDRLLYTDLKTFLPELNLAYSDKLTAAASVEGRVPFLDNEVVEFAAKLPSHYKLRRGTGKYLLRKAMRGRLPDSVISRGKAGFGAPIRKWLRDELRPMVHDLLSQDVIRRRGYFDAAEVSDLVHRNETGLDDQPMRVWALLTLELWHRAFMDSSPTSSVPAQSSPIHLAVTR